MDLAQFQAEAEKLARRATLLSVSGKGNPVAYWHGVRRGEPCISLRRKGSWLNVHLSGTTGDVELRRDALRSSMPLFAEELISLPPVDAVFLQGSGAVAAYLQRNGWKRTDPFNSTFPDRVPHEYEKLWQKNCPLYTNTAAALCGGWHFPWPDGDFLQLVDSELVVWTLMEAEPWIEVFERGDVFAVKQRIT